MKKELKLYKNIFDNAYLLGYYSDYIVGILLNDCNGDKKGRFSTSWNKSVFKECDDISSGNISITSNVADVYLDPNNNPVMKCTSMYGTIHILINSMSVYKGVLEDLKKVDKVIIKVHKF